MSKRKTGTTALLHRKSVLAVNLAVVTLIAWGFAGEYMRSRDMQTEIDRLEEQAASLESRNLELADMADRFSSSSMLEREARLKLNMQKPGEEVVVVREDDGMVQVAADPDGTAAAEEAGQQTKAVSNIKKWISHILSNDK